jgi:hypothetical protein
MFLFSVFKIILLFILSGIDLFSIACISYVVLVMVEVLHFP